MSAKPRPKRPRTPKHSRKKRPRPTPTMIAKSETDEMAKRRCLMILAVLSGTVPVTDAIREAKISRGTYYKLEERALEAMLAALAPRQPEVRRPKNESSRRIEQLTEKVAKLEADKRRLERLLSLSKQVLGRGPVKSAAKRMRRGNSRRAGSNGSKRSRAAESMDRTTDSGHASTRRPVGGAAL